MFEKKNKKKQNKTNQKMVFPRKVTGFRVGRCGHRHDDVADVLIGRKWRHDRHAYANEPLSLIASSIASRRRHPTTKSNGRHRRGTTKATTIATANGSP